MTEDDGSCVQCGFCCRQRPCLYGLHAGASGSGPCRFLTDDDLCSLHDEIVERERGASYPMMGSGCSSTLFNERRDGKLARRRIVGQEVTT